MRIRKPSYYDGFTCLAGACPDTCCAAWEAVVDGESLARYQALPGTIGRTVRDALTVDGDGDACFRLAEGRCALLRGDGLCALQAELGEEALCQVCREHPRFLESFGPFRETSLAASCPEAARLTLAWDGQFTEAVTDEPEEDCEDVDGALLAALLPCRERLFGLLRDRSGPVEARMAAALGYAGALQERLDLGNVEGLAHVIPPQAPPAGTAGERLETARALFRVLGTLEILSPEWKALLDEAAGALADMSEDTYAARRRDFVRARLGREAEEENFAVYLLYRWFLKADFDGDVYGKVSFAALSLLALQELGALTLAREGRFTQDGQLRLVGLWCKEQEHCDENLAALAQAAYDEPLFGPEPLGRALNI